MDKHKIVGMFTKEELLGLYLCEVYSLYQNEGHWPERTITRKYASKYFNELPLTILKNDGDGLCIDMEVNGDTGDTFDMLKSEEIVMEDRDKLIFIKEYVEAVSEKLAPINFGLDNDYKDGARRACEMIIEKIEQLQKGGLIKNVG